MSLAALTDSTTAIGLSLEISLPASGNSRKTISPKSSMAFSVIPTSPFSIFIHSWVFANFFIGFSLSYDIYAQQMAVQ